MSTLQRALDARAKVTISADGGDCDWRWRDHRADRSAGISSHADAASMIAAGLWLASHAWSCRDLTATALAPAFPRTAAFLKRF